MDETPKAEVNVTGVEWRTPHDAVVTARLAYMGEGGRGGQRSWVISADTLLPTGWHVRVWEDRPDSYNVMLAVGLRLAAKADELAKAEREVSKQQESIRAFITNLIAELGHDVDAAAT